MLLDPLNMFSPSSVQKDKLGIN